MGGRRERLDVLKKASRFVDDADVRRDFTVQIRSSAMPVAQVGSVEITFDGRQHGTADRAAFTATSTSSGSRGDQMKRSGQGLASMEAAIAASVAGVRAGGPSIPDYHPAVRPPGGPPPGSRIAQAVRNGRLPSADPQGTARSGLTPS